MEPAHYTLLLPEIFRHKTTKVRVFKPKVVLLDFHGTISERKWEEKVIFPYVKRALGTYLRENWTNPKVQSCIAGLRNESFEQRFRNKYEDAPIIEDSEDVNPINLANQMSDFVGWQISTKRETKESQIIERLVWEDGFKRRQILLPLYEDVLDSVRRWRDEFSCRIYVISSIDSVTLKLLFENTDKGNLHQFLSGYLSCQQSGEKLVSETYKNFYHNLKCDESVELKPRKEVHSPPSNSSISSSSSTKSLKIRNEQQQQVVDQALLPRPILFLTDSGQEAKAASQVNESSSYECLLMNRPGNKRIRTYYLSQFAYINKLDDVEMIKY